MLQPALPIASSAIVAATYSCRIIGRDSSRVVAGGRPNGGAAHGGGWPPMRYADRSALLFGASAGRRPRAAFALPRHLGLVAGELAGGMIAFPIGGEAAVGL